jgi:hypothetical protein
MDKPVERFVAAELQHRTLRSVLSLDQLKIGYQSSMPFRQGMKHRTFFCMIRLLVSSQRRLTPDD